MILVHQLNQPTHRYRQQCLHEVDVGMKQSSGQEQEELSRKSRTFFQSHHKCRLILSEPESESLTKCSRSTPLPLKSALKSLETLKKLADIKIGTREQAQLFSSGPVSLLVCYSDYVPLILLCFCYCCPPLHQQYQPQLSSASPYVRSFAHLVAAAALTPTGMSSTGRLQSH